MKNWTEGQIIFRLGLTITIILYVLMVSVGFHWFGCLIFCPVVGFFSSWVVAQLIWVHIQNWND